jgi:hypothetical protein
MSLKKNKKLIDEITIFHLMQPPKTKTKNKNVKAYFSTFTRETYFVLWIQLFCSNISNVS